MYCNHCGATLATNAQGCWRCNTTVSKPEPVISAVSVPISLPPPINTGLYGVGGWLLFFWISIGFAPFFLLSNAIRAKATLPGAISICLAVLCVVIAFQMYRHDPNAIALLRIFILIEVARALMAIAIATYGFSFR